MRTLTSTLTAAQQASGAVPAVRLTRRRASAGEDRYTLSFLAGSGSLSDPYAVTASGGVLRMWAIHAGSVRVDYYQGSPLVFQSGGTRWSTTDTLIAAAQQQNTPANVAVVTAAPGASTLSLRFSGSGDAGFGAAETLNLPNGVAYQAQAVACCFAPDGRVFVAVQGTQYITVFVRATNATYTSASNPADGHYSAMGIGCCYTVSSGAGDLAIYASAGYTAGTWSELVTLLFGDGALQGAGSFSVHQTVLITKPYVTGPGTAPGTILSAGGLCLADTFRATFYEDFQNPQMSLATKRNFAQSVLKPANVKAGYARDPQALPVDAAAVLKPAWDAQNGILFYANPANIYYGMAPLTQDLSARVLRCTRTERENGAGIDVLLDNSDLSLAALAQSADSIGDRLSLDFGYVTSAGAEYSVSMPLWLSRVTASGAGGTRYAEITAHDGWQVLAAWRPRRLYSWLPGESTIAQILQWILARAGLDFTPPASPSVLLQSSPAFAVHPASSGAQAVHELLDQIPEVLLFTAAGAVLRLPQSTDPPVYTYAPGGHAVLTARRSCYAQGLNHVLLYGKNTGTATTPTLIGEALDASDAQRIADYPFALHDMQVSTANAAARAAVPLRKAQLITDAGEIAAAPNVGLEPWDAIGITEGFSGMSGATLRVRELRTLFDTLREGGVYTQSVGLMNP
ncbi:MAG TPA: hypothetical protein VKV26_06645 [Dehalococcoidia bacterium]|nr:hypothetical protein [Dehalococcoidia bacterium]